MSEKEKLETIIKAIAFHAYSLGQMLSCDCEEADGKMSFCPVCLHIHSIDSLLDESGVSDE